MFWGAFGKQRESRLMRRRVADCSRHDFLWPEKHGRRQWHADWFMQSCRTQFVDVPFLNHIKLAFIMCQCVVYVFSQTWLRYVWLMLSQIRPSVCRLWRACILLMGFNFSGIFLHPIVAWPSGNLPTKNHEDRPRESHPTGALNARGRKKL